MSRNLRLYLDDMLTGARKVARYTHAMRRDDFLADEKTYDAVIRNLEIVSEAAKAVPASMRARSPDIDWRKIAGLRDILAHAYYRIDHDVLWDVVQHHIPRLIERLSAHLEAGTFAEEDDNLAKQ